MLDKLYYFVNSIGILTSKYQDSCVILILLIISYQIFDNFNVISRVKTSYPINPIYFSNSSLKNPICMKDFVNENIPEFRENAKSLFNPFLYNGHLQTMFAGIRTFKNSDILYFRRRIKLISDGGSVALDNVISKETFDEVKSKDIKIPDEQPESLDDHTRYMTAEEIKHQDQHSDDEGAILIALTGLSGSSAESYIRCLFKRISEDKTFDLYVLNSRGCGNCNLSTPRLFCALWTEDIRTIVKSFKSQYPNKKIYLFGVSLGSTIMMNYLAQEGENSNISLAIAFGSIWDLRGSSYFLENGWISSIFYSTAMTYPLIKLLKYHSTKLLNDLIFKNQFDHIHKVWKLKDFDNTFTSKMFGFTCADDYYLNASPINRIYNIKTPFINISALDDPISGGLSIGAIPIDQAKFNPFISMINTTLGGHVGFFKWNNERWYADPLSKLLSKFHEQITSKENYEVLADEESMPKAVFVDGKLPVHNNI